MNYSKLIFFTLIFTAITGAPLLTLEIEQKVYISDPTQLQSIQVGHLYIPTTIGEIQNIILSAPTPISVKGTNYSQGGHTVYRNGSVIDMKNFNHVKSFDLYRKTITVEAGITWREIQKYISPYNLSVKVMQSYNDFSVGGSLSVNVHGRDIHYGPLIESIESITLIGADGVLITASRRKNYDLFKAAIGGYGAFGVIIEATISLTTNEKLKRDVKLLDYTDYPEYFLSHIKSNSNIVLHNANLYPDDLTQMIAINWVKTDKIPTQQKHIQPKVQLYPFKMLLEQIATRVAPVKNAHINYDLQAFCKPAICLRNYEMSTTVNTLKRFTQLLTTTVLQEYFVPTEHLIPFIDALRIIAKNYSINFINISIRYVPKNTESLLSYSPQDCFSLVLYINIFNTSSGKKTAQLWTRELINAALQYHGTYYLPYQPYALVDQFQQAYPHWQEFVEIKKKYDPNNKFSNTFLNKYLPQ